jgi:hypothetical protein
MVNRCIKCRKIVDSTRIYCKACEAEIRKKEEIKLRKDEQWNKADFFQRQKLK